MSKLDFPFVAPKTLDINGRVFDVLMSEDEIFDRMLYFADAYKDVRNASRERSRLDELYGFCDQMLGEGAFQSIVKSHPLSIKDKACLVMKIAETACYAYRDKVAGYDE